MKTKSTEKGRVSAAEMAGLIRRSEERLRQLVRQGVLPAPVRGRYAPVATLAAWAQHLDARLAERQDGGKARMAAARAALLEHRLEVERRHFLPLEEVRRDITRGFTELKSQLLTIPRRLAQPLAMETDAVIVEERMEKEILAVLEHASRGGLVKEAVEAEKEDSEK